MREMQEQSEMDALTRLEEECAEGAPYASVHMPAHMSVRMSIHVSVQMSIRISVQTFPHTCAHERNRLEEECAAVHVVYTHAYTYMHMSVYTCLYTYLCTYARVYIHVYTHCRMHGYSDAYAHAHTHACTHVFGRWHQPQWSPLLALRPSQACFVCAHAHLRTHVCACTHACRFHGDSDRSFSEEDDQA